jgi:hypothetical protein
MAIAASHQAFGVVLSALLPTTRMSAAMHDRDNGDISVEDDVAHHVREPPKRRLSNVIGRKRILLGILLD